MGAQLTSSSLFFYIYRKIIVAYLFLEHCSVNKFFFVSHGEDRFLLTFMDFFTHVRAWGNVTWKEASILTFYLRVLSLAIRFSLKEFFFVSHNDWSCMLIDFWEPRPVPYSDVIYFMSLSPDLTAPYWTKMFISVSIQRTSQYFFSDTYDVSNSPSPRLRCFHVHWLNFLFISLLCL